MNIGKKIKLLRKENDITQEKLAAYLNVSCQAISKWEKETASPDISLIVPIANFFDVTTDELFDRDAEKQRAEIQEFLDKASYLAKRGLVKDEIDLWRTAVAKYPNNYQCLTQYAYALFSAKNSDAFDDDKGTADNYTKKALEICERILADCTENEYRSCATQILVMIYGDEYGNHHNEEKAETYANQAPQLYFCSDLLLENVYKANSEKYLARKHSNALQFVDLLTNHIAFAKYKDSNEKIFALKTALAIWNAVFYDDNFLFYHCRIAQIYRYLAIEYAKLKSKSDVLESLKMAKIHSQAKENLPDGKHYYTNIFLNKAYHDTSNEAKNFSCSEIDIISNLLADKVFDFMRESKEFLDFKNTLYN